MTIETREETAILPILSHWINGTAVEVLPEQTGPITNPATGKVFARVPRGGQAEVDAAVAAASAAFPAWRDLPLIARSNIFFQFRNLMYEHREELAAFITRDHGKTFPDALAEVMRGIETIDFACGLPVHLAGMMTPNVSTKVDAFTFRAPLGVVAAITPFNFPVMVPTWIYPIALMTGNTVILKPSSHTPGATQLQAELWTQAGGPDGTFNIVYGGREAVKAIVEHPASAPSSSWAPRPWAATSTRRAPSAASASGPTPAPRTRCSSCPTRTWTWSRTRRSRPALARPVSAAWPRR